MFMTVHRNSSKLFNRSTYSFLGLLITTYTNIIYLEEDYIVTCDACLGCRIK